MVETEGVNSEVPSILEVLEPSLVPCHGLKGDRRWAGALKALAVRVQPSGRPESLFQPCSPVRGVVIHRVLPACWDSDAASGLDIGLGSGGV